ARWLVARGARSLVLAARREPGDDARRAIGELVAAGASVRTVRCDVASRAEVTALLEAIAAEGPALRGLVHPAGGLAAALLQQLDAGRFEAVMAPKVLGALHLDELTAGLPLDLFVLFSSAASLLGSTGQANYAAANAVLDAIAHRRRARGLAALSVN